MDDVKRTGSALIATGKPTPGSWRRLDKPLREPSAEGKAWLVENREAIEEFNAWYETNGSPLYKYRVL